MKTACANGNNNISGNNNINFHNPINDNLTRYWNINYYFKPQTIFYLSYTVIVQLLRLYTVRIMNKIKKSILNVHTL